MSNREINFMKLVKLFKRSILIILILLIGYQSNSQTKAIALTKGMFQTIDIVSPQINDDGSIIFRLLAPGAKEVVVDGDFAPSAIRPIRMSKNESGVWEVTINLELQPELYSYCFFVDGLRMIDPSNIAIIRNDTQYYNYFIYGETPYRNDNKKVPRGSINHIWYHSQTFGMNRCLTIYLPACYNPLSVDKKYKVLYLLHGMGGDEDSWMRFGRISAIMDNMIASSSIEPIIVVMPNGNVDVDSAPTESAIGYLTPNPYLPKTLEGSFESSFEEIIAFVEANYQTIKSKLGRAIAGYSMGGVNALYIALSNPDTFGYVGLFSPALGMEQVEESNVYGKVLKNINLSYKSLIENDFKLFETRIGSQDPFVLSAKNNHDILKKISEDTSDINFNLVYKEYPGGHIWTIWRKSLIDFLNNMNNCN